MWAWYVERRDELLIDLDRATPRRLAIVRQCVEAADRSGKLPLASVWFYPSQEKGYHLYVRTRGPFPTAADQWAWALWLGDDRRRRARCIMRWITGAWAWALLIEPYPLDVRAPDYVCECPGKHTPATMEGCPVSESLDGMADTGSLFGIADPSTGPWSDFGRVFP